MHNTDIQCLGDYHKTFKPLACNQQNELFTFLFQFQLLINMLYTSFVFQINNAT